MGIEQLKTMKEQLVGCVQSQLNDLSKVDAKQLGQAIDMIKDLSQAVYYCTITDSMEKVDNNKQQQQRTNINYYTVPYYDLPKKAYYKAGSGNMMYYPGNDENVSYYTEMTDMNRDPREGRSPMRRRLYMQGKEHHNDVTSQLRQLEAYLQELSTDITEMIKDASPQERATLRQKMTTLANKIN